MSRTAKGRDLVVSLPPDDYAKLDQLAAAEERDAWQQARWLLRQAIHERYERRPVETHGARLGARSATAVSPARG